MINMLLEQQHPVRAFVRRDDERAAALRQIGAEVFVGDLLNVADVAAALAQFPQFFRETALAADFAR